MCTHRSEEKEENEEDEVGAEEANAQKPATNSYVGRRTSEHEERRTNAKRRKDKGRALPFLEKEKCTLLSTAYSKTTAVAPPPAAGTARGKPDQRWGHYKL